MRSPNFTVNRRRALAALAAGLLWGGLAPSAARSETGTRALLEALPTVVGLSKRLGRACWRCVGEDRSALNELLAQHGALPQHPHATNIEAMASELRRQIESDFEIGNTVSVDGWILSKTETQLFALAYVAGHAR